jgi:8-oxo-dGTP pyrophosphatase MutT (NUDIX family)
MGEARAKRPACLVVTEVVRAAGGVVVRCAADAQLNVLLVHRPAYSDWTLPKGKAAPKESDEDCARREVEEETGLRCQLGRELASSEYSDARGRAKRVRYWLMWPLSGAAAAHAEVDRVRWATLDEADALLSYDRDRTVLRSLPRELADLCG